MKTLIIVVIAIGLVSVIAVIVVGTRNFEGIVVEKPYETGLAWDSAEGERESLGWSVDIRTKKFRIGENDVLLRISDKEGKPLSLATVMIMVSRPSTNVYDKTYRAIDRTDGIYEAQVRLPLFGYWDMNVGIVKEGGHVVLLKEIFADKEKD